MPSNPIDQFVDKLIEQAGLGDVAEDKKEEYRQNILTLVQQKLGIELMKILPEQAVDEFIALTEKNTPADKLQYFFKKNIPDFDTKVQSALDSFEADFVNVLKQSDSFSQDK